MSSINSSETAMVIPWWTGLIQGIFSIIIGVLLLTYPAATTTVIVQFVGLQWLISGIFLLVNIFVDKALWGWKLIAGILGILAGLSVFQHPLWSTVLLPTVLVIFLGITGLLIGFISLIAAFKGGGWAAGILGILSILFGLLLLGSPLIAAFTLPFLYGIIELVGGIGAIIASIRRKNENKGYPYDEK